MRIFQRQIGSMIGLDVGSSSVKLVHLLQRKGKRKVLSAVEEPCVSAPDGNGDGRVEAINRVFKRAGIKSGRGDAIVTAVSGPSTAVKQVEFPLLTDEELQSSIKWQAGKRLPFGPDEAVLDYQVLGRDEATNKMNVLLVAVTRPHLAEHLQLLRAAGVDPLIIDLSPLALANAVMGTQELEGTRAVAVLDIGASNTILDVFAPGDFFFTRDIAVTSRQLTGKTSRHEDGGLKEVVPKKDGPKNDDRKEKTDDNGKTLSGKQESGGRIPEIVKTPLDRLVFELRKSLTYYENRRGRGGFEKLFLAGGGGQLAQLADYFHARLGVPVEKFNPFNGLDAAGDQAELAKAAPQLALAVGLALRRVGKKNV